MQVARFPSIAVVLVLLQLLVYDKVTAATWCVAGNNATVEELQKALDFACGFGADCGPIQQSGECFLPNTVQAHASYAFNSYYMRTFMAPGSCNFAGTAVVTRSDPSYESCVYPDSPSVAGETQTPPMVSPPPPPLVDAPPPLAPSTPPLPQNDAPPPLVSSTPPPPENGAPPPLVSSTSPPPQNGAPLDGSGGVLTPTDMNGTAGEGAAALTPTSMAATPNNSPSKGLPRLSISILFSVVIICLFFLLM